MACGSPFDTASTYAVLVINDSGAPLCALQLRRAQDPQWSANRLPQGAELPWGGLLLLGSLRQGDYVLRATPCDETSAAIEQPFSIAPGQQAPRLVLHLGNSPRQEYSLTLTMPTVSGESYCAVEMTPLYTPDGQPGPTIPSPAFDAPLQSGDRFTLDNLAPGYYEVRVARCDAGSYSGNLAIGEGQTSEWQVGTDAPKTLEMR